MKLAIFEQIDVMEEGTFTLVDNRIFCSINQYESNKDVGISKKSNKKITYNNSGTESEEKTDISFHKKISKRKLSLKKSKTRKKGKKKKTSSKSKTNIQNNFEFCTTIDYNIDIKQEFANTTEIKSESDSDDDVPLASLEKHSCNTTLPEFTKKQKETLPNHRFDIKLFEKSKENNEKNLSTENESQDLFCSKCNKLFETKKKYRHHLQETHGKLYKCKLCLRSFSEKEDYEDHQNHHTGNRPYCCYVCENESFKTEKSLKSHMKTYHSGQQIKEREKFSCYICGKELSSTHSLEEHIRIHTGEKPVTCKICDKTFTRENDLRHHQNVHDELWKCKRCQKCFPTPFKLKEHLRSHTGELPYECDKCDRKFARVGDFRYHIGTHLGIKPYNCDECGMHFTTSSSVTRHRLNMHQSGPKMYNCPHCFKKFYTQTRLSTHLKSHENKKRFKCELCPAARNSLSELNKHMIIHGGQYRCDTCHRGFQNAQRLAIHTARHDIAGKPYACFVCSIGYNSSQGLNKHLATVHRNEDIPQIAPQHLCTICGQVFELKDKLNRHLKENHIVIVIGEIHPIEFNEDHKMEDSKISDNNHLSVIKDCNIKVSGNAKENDIKITISSEKHIESSNDSSGAGNSINESLKNQIVENIEKNITLPPINTNEKNVDSVIKEKPSESISQSMSNESLANGNASTAEHCDKTRLHLNVPIINKSSGNFVDLIAKDLSSTSYSDSTSKTEKKSIVDRKSYEENSTRTYFNMPIQESNPLLSSNYRPFMDNQIQAQNINHINNPWILSKPNDSMSVPPQILPRSNYDTKQKYELRMPKFNALPTHQLHDYRNVISENTRLMLPEHRIDILQTPSRNRDIANDQKYYYETGNVRNLKEYYSDIHQRESPDDRRKYTQQLSTDLSQNHIHNYSNHMISSRDFNALGPRDLSNPSNMNVHNLHYPNHSFPPSPNLFQNFRDLQHRILKTHEYGNIRHVSQSTGMDMTNHHLNPSSPLSPYNQANVLDNMSPISRNSYEDSSNSQMSNSIVYGHHSRVTSSGIESNPEKIENNANAEQVNGERSYEMRVGAT